MTSVSVQKLIFLATAYRETNIAAIAKAIGISRQNLHRKINGNNLKKEDLCSIAKALGGKYVSYIYFPGGVIIGDKIKRGKSKKSGNEAETGS